MITLITGIPGSGKTAYVVSELLKVEGRPIFVDGVPDLAIEHDPCPAVGEWTEERPDPASASGTKTCFTFPPNAIIVIDECQRVYRPRPVGSKVPPFVSAFETHRHEGLDFWLITQNPTLLDSNVRKLVGRHVHFRVTWAGRYMHEWAEVADVESSTARGNAATTRYKLPKQAFNKYKSAVLHTKNKAKIPLVAYVFLAAILGSGFFGWKIWERYNAMKNPKPAPVAQSAPGAAPASHQGQGGAPKTAEEYIAEYKPRIAGLLHTAPAYDEVTKPKQPPEIVGCIERKKTGDCLCYDQQGNKYPTTPQMCVHYLHNGIFMAWKTPPDQLAQQQQQQAKPPASAAETAPGPFVHVLGGDSATPAPSRPVPAPAGNDSTNPRYNVAARG